MATRLSIKTGNEDSDHHTIRSSSYSQHRRTNLMCRAKWSTCIVVANRPYCKDWHESRRETIEGRETLLVNVSRTEPENSEFSFMDTMGTLLAT